MSFIWQTDTPLGGVILAGDGDALTGLWFEGQRFFGSTLGDDPRQRRLEVFCQAEEWLQGYFDGERMEHTPPLRLIGTPFQRAVWEALYTVPYGQTATYGELARRAARNLGTDRAFPRAVGGAVARNPIALMIPCHRIIGADGSLTGYAGGVQRKAWLLRLESGQVSVK